MYTRQDKLDDVTQTLLTRYGSNIIRIRGIGSFFDNDINQEYNPQKDRTIDLHVVINDIDAFYKNHIISTTELNEYGIQEYDKMAVRKVLDSFISANAIVPLYHLNKDEGYRITVIPYDKLKEWLSLDSPIGYFLVGRWQKPMHELMLSDTEKNNGVEEHINHCADIGVQIAFSTLSGRKTVYEIIRHIYYLSYHAEGVRGLDGLLLKKPSKMLQRKKQESYKMYKNKIKDYARELGYLDSEGFISIPRSYSEAQFELKDFKKWSVPRFLRTLYYLEQVFPNPKEFAQKKILRTIKLDDSKEFNKAIANLFLAPLRKYQYHQMLKLPRKLIPNRIKEKIL
jgi:hypothetical protein